MFFYLQHLNYAVLLDILLLSTRANMDKKGEEMKKQTLEEWEMIFQTISNEVRLKILAVLYKHESLMVTDVYEKIGAKQATTSTYLNQMKLKKIVDRTSDHNKNYYHIQNEKVNQIMKLILLNEDEFYEKIDKLIILLKQFSTQSKIEIMLILHLKGELKSTDIFALSDTNKSVISQSLGKMTTVGALEKRIENNANYYRIKHPFIHDLLDVIVNNP